MKKRKIESSVIRVTKRGKLQPALVPDTYSITLNYNRHLVLLGDWDQTCSDLAAAEPGLLGKLSLAYCHYLTGT